MDAVLDLEEDRAQGRYNPVAAFAEGKTEDDLRYNEEGFRKQYHV